MMHIASTRIKRRIASMMLVCWLFALGAGWANACILQERGSHQHQHLAAAGHAEMSTVSAGDVEILDGHKADASPGNAACLKVCNASSQTLVKGSSGIDMLDLTMLPPIAVAWSVSVLALNALRTAQIEPLKRAALPLRTRYARLAL